MELHVHNAKLMHQAMHLGEECRLLSLERLSNQGYSVKSMYVLVLRFRPWLYFNETKQERMIFFSERSLKYNG